MAKPTREEIKNYLNWLGDPYGVVKSLYKQTQDAYLLTLHDTLEDEFQIVADIDEVFSKWTEKHLTMFAPDPPSALVGDDESNKTAGG